MNSKTQKRLARFATGAAMFGLASLAHASGTPFDTISAGVDLSSVATWVGTIGLTIVGIALGFKAIGLSKRGVKMA